MHMNSSRYMNKKQVWLRQLRENKIETVVSFFNLVPASRVLWTLSTFFTVFFLGKVIFWNMLLCCVSSKSEPIRPTQNKRILSRRPGPYADSIQFNRFALRIRRKKSITGMSTMLFLKVRQTERYCGCATHIHPYPATLTMSSLHLANGLPILRLPVCGYHQRSFSAISSSSGVPYPLPLLAENIYSF